MPRILVVEDDDLMRDGLRQMIEREGHEALAAENGLLGLKLFQTHEIDLVITDVLMPEKDGLELIKEIRACNPEVKIIAMSGGGRISSKNYLSVAKRLGANGTLTKPFLRKDLIESLRAIFSET